MTKNIFSALTAAILLLATSAPGRSQSEKLDRIRVARASDSATEAALWFAKEGGFFEKHGIFAELIRFQGSSLVVSTMLAGEVAISQIGAAAVVDSGLAGGDLINVASIIRNFVFYIFSRPEIERITDLKGKAMGTSRYGAISDFAARFALAKNGLQPEKDVAILQTGGPSESVAALSANRIQAVALTAPATIRARKLGLRPLLDISKLEANFPFNGIVVRKSFLKSNENLLRRFMMAYIEGVALAKKDAPFAKKVMAKYFKSEDREILDESYDWIVKQNFTLPPYPAIPGLVTILKSVEARNPKAKDMKPEDFVDMGIVQELDKSGFIANAMR
ncbi:MAG TPA: ABC transporter substrate-binding protein [Candidatus Binatia bacterium]|nr:ABC transporter substrate-binding protein [Candidatus Binatia bacterium]